MDEKRILLHVMRLNTLCEYLLTRINGTMCCERMFVLICLFSLGTLNIKYLLVQTLAACVSDSWKIENLLPR